MQFSCWVDLSIFSFLFVSLLMRNTEGSALCIIFTEKGKGLKGKRHATWNTANFREKERGFRKSIPAFRCFLLCFFRPVKTASNTMKMWQGHEAVYHRCCPIFLSLSVPLSSCVFTGTVCFWGVTPRHVAAISRTINLLVNTLPCRNVSVFMDAWSDFGRLIVS